MLHVACRCAVNAALTVLSSQMAEGSDHRGVRWCGCTAGRQHTTRSVSTSVGVPACGKSHVARYRDAAALLAGISVAEMDGLCQAIPTITSTLAGKDSCCGCMHVRTRVSVRACAHARARVRVYVYVFACAALLGDEEDFVLSSAMLCLAKVRQSRTLLCTPTDKPPARKRSSCTSACALACTHRWTYACTYAWMTHACVHACMRCCAAHCME